MPPHWELVFQIEKEYFGMDYDVVKNAAYSSEESRQKADLAYHVEKYGRLVDECGWAVAPGFYSVNEVAATKKVLGDRALVPAYEGGGVFWMPTGQDMMDFTVQLYEDFDGLLAKARQKCDAAKEFFVKAVDVGADFFVLTYDFGYNDGPFVSPEHFNKLCAPYLAECVQKIHELKRKVILHSDGCLTQILEQIHDTGIDGYQSVDPQGHMDIKKVRDKYPDWILMGNVACNMMQDTNEAQIRDSVRYCMKHGGIGKRYIFSTSNCIFNGMPKASYEIMLDEYNKLIKTI